MHDLLTYRLWKHFKTSWTPVVHNTEQ